MQGIEITKEPTIDTSSSLTVPFNSSIVKELNKRVYTFPKEARLKGPENFDQWKQTLYI